MPPTDREIMQKALKALKDVVDAEEARSWGVFGVDKQTPLKRARSAITALRERLAQPEQEPVAWLHRDSWGTLKLSQTMPPPVGAFPVYTAPQPAPTIDKSAARRIATALGWEPPREEQEQEPVAKWDASAPLVVHPHPAFQATPPRREWVGLTEEDFSAINQSCLTKLQAATSAESILKGKNNG